MAREWADVPEYTTSLERTLGPGSAPDFMRRIEEHSGEMLTQGRGLFERWLDTVAA